MLDVLLADFPAQRDAAEETPDMGDTGMVHMRIDVRFKAQATQSLTQAAVS